MSLFTDIEFLHQISYRLQRFKKIDERTWNCRCSICGDSQKNQAKARGYFYQQGNRLNYKCHNCGVSISFKNFIRQFDQSLFDQYLKANYKDSNETPNFRNKIIRKTTAIWEETIPEVVESPIAGLNKVSDATPHWTTGTPFKTVLGLPKNHPIIEYLHARLIPESQFDNFGYIDHMIDLVEVYPKYEKLIKTNEMRLVIPFIDKNGILIGATCRGMRDEIPRYVELKFVEDVVLAFGMDKVDTSKTVYILEGAIDACFVPNSIAVAGMQMQKLKALNLDKSNCVLVLDNQPKHRDVVNAMDKFITEGYRVCVWPKVVKGKDINAMIISGEVNVDGLVDLIDNNTFSGLLLRLNFNKWKGI